MNMIILILFSTFVASSLNAAWKCAIYLKTTFLIFAKFQNSFSVAQRRQKLELFEVLTVRMLECSPANKNYKPFKILIVEDLVECHWSVPSCILD